MRGEHQVDLPVIQQGGKCLIEALVIAAWQVAVVAVEKLATMVVDAGGAKQHDMNGVHQCLVYL
ncbi:hypothetical protein D3C78_1566500 [compost metagenome]